MGAILFLPGTVPLRETVARAGSVRRCSVRSCGWRNNNRCVSDSTAYHSTARQTGRSSWRRTGVNPAASSGGQCGLFAAVNRQHVSPSLGRNRNVSRPRSGSSPTGRTYSHPAESLHELNSSCRIATIMFIRRDGISARCVAVARQPAGSSHPRASGRSRSMFTSRQNSGSGQLVSQPVVSIAVVVAACCNRWQRGDGPG